jgi:hypothetical protein
LKLAQFPSLSHPQVRALEEKGAKQSKELKQNECKIDNLLHQLAKASVSIRSSSISRALCSFHPFVVSWVQYF